MSERDVSPQPVLADVVLAPAPQRGMGLASGGVLAGVLLAASWLLLPGPAVSHVPKSPADLGAGIITTIAPNDPDAINAAIAMFKVDGATRRHIEQDVLAGRRRLGWIVVQDSMDPDGDMIEIESSGIAQQVVLVKAWMPVPVLLGESNTIGITGIRDGEGGGITLALVTAGGQVPLRPLTPGERIAVAAE
jgi:hypothetical protein